jgi:hypothetical protein
MSTKPIDKGILWVWFVFCAFSLICWCVLLRYYWNISALF